MDKQQKEQQLQERVSKDLQAELESKVYGVTFDDEAMILQALKYAIEKHTPDTLKCGYDTFKVLYEGNKPLSEYTFYEIMHIFNVIAAASPATLNGCCAGYIAIQDYVRAQGKDWNTTVAARRAELEKKHRALAAIIKPSNGLIKA